jgi:hypothetical protein
MTTSGAAAAAQGQSWQAERRPARAPLNTLDVATVVALAIALLLGAPPPASANNFTGASGGTLCSQNMADNENHYVWNQTLTQPTLDAANWVRVYTYNPTVINTYTEDIRTSQTDVILHDDDYDTRTCGLQWRTSSTATTGIVGLSECRSLSGSKCQQFYVYFDTDYMGPKSLAQERWLACHELGHTVGLKHQYAPEYRPTCMHDDPNVSNPSTLHAHDITHLTSSYP